MGLCGPVNHSHCVWLGGDPANTIEFISMYSATNSPLIKIMVLVQVFVQFINCSIFLVDHYIYKNCEQWLLKNCLINPKYIMCTLCPGLVTSWPQLWCADKHSTTLCQTCVPTRPGCVLRTRLLFESRVQSVRHQPWIWISIRVIIIIAHITDPVKLAKLHSALFVIILNTPVRLQGNVCCQPQSYGADP